jgi:hypothetical protein
MVALNSRVSLRRALEPWRVPLSGSETYSFPQFAESLMSDASTHKMTSTKPEAAMKGAERDDRGVLVTLVGSNETIDLDGFGVAS